MAGGVTGVGEGQLGARNSGGAPRRGDRALGGGDLLGSHDVEDILAIVASRPSLVSECAPAPERVQGVLRAMAGTLIASEDTLGEVLQAHVVVDHGHDHSQVHLFARDHRRLLAALR